MMFSYYGSKSKIIKKYPPPLFPTIIEPFAGSARYALLYPSKNVVLNDSYEVIYNVWKYLINSTEDSIKRLPNLKRGEDLRTINLPQVEKDLMGFMVNRGAAYPHNIYTKWAFEGNEIERIKNKIIKNLPLIKHWQVTCKDYREIDNIEATWFIDPPYQIGGERYVKNKINYEELAEWCKSRRGQVIACENGLANWLPFAPLTTLTGQKKKTMEVMWTNETT